MLWMGISERYLFGGFDEPEVLPLAPAELRPDRRPGFLEDFRCFIEFHGFSVFIRRKGPHFGRYRLDRRTARTKTIAGFRISSFG